MLERSLNNGLLRNVLKGSAVSRRFRDACGLQFLLTSQMQDLMKSQKTVQEAVKSLEGPASKTVIDEVTICHLRPMRLPLNKYDESSLKSVSAARNLKTSMLFTSYRH